MLLKDWYRLQTPAARIKAATACGISPSYLTYLSRGKNPSPRVALKIEKFTAGAVSRHDLLPAVYPYSGCTCDACLHRQEQEGYATVVDEEHAHV